jgi:transcriptional regulator with XRE-family HTH domain
MDPGRKNGVKGRRKEDRARSLAMVLLRYRRGWYEKQKLAQEAGFTPSQVSMWELGERPLSAEALERTAEATGFPPHLLDPLMRGLRSFLAASEGRSLPARALEDATSAEMVAFLGECMDALPVRTLPAARVPSPDDREEAADLWVRLERREPELRRVLIEEAEEYRGWALCERVAAESLGVDDPRKSLELAELALRIARGVPGEQTWRWRLEGYALAHVANARRACGDLAGAERDFAEARRLWIAGEPGDRGLLDDAVIQGFREMD